MFTPILELFTVITVAILPQVLISFYPEELRKLLSNLPGNWKFISTLPSRVGAILLILYIAANRLDNFHSIGLNLREAVSLKTLLITGFLTVYLLLIFVFSSLRSGKTKEEITKAQQKTLLVLRYSNTTNPWQKLYYFVDLWLAVIGEELVYRGYLVLILGGQTGNFAPWIIFSLALSIVVHLYQGRIWRLALSHMILASLFVLAAVYTRSLFAAIVPHLVYNTTWLAIQLRNPSQNLGISEGAS